MISETILNIHILISAYYVQGHYYSNNDRIVFLTNNYLLWVLSLSTIIPFII